MPIVDPVELEELRKTTLDLIEEDHAPIALVRSSYERTPAGGIRKTNDTPLPAEDRFFSTTLGRTGMSHTIRTEQGEELVSNHILIGPYGDDIRKGDAFVWENRNFTAEEIDPDVSYQTKAWCVERA